MLKNLVYLIVAWVLIGSSHAQMQSVNVAVSVETKNNEGDQGHIVSIDEKGSYILSDRSSDSRMYGVLVKDPVLSLQDSNITNAKYLVTTGETLVLVNGEGGPIKMGDFITSSSVKGQGKKATTSGYVVGVALEDYTPKNSTDAGLVLANVKISSQFISNSPRANLVQVIRSGLDAPSAAPVDSLRYIIAGLVICASFVIGFTSFGRTSGSSIEAMGRNPLAKNTIRTTVVFNFVLTALIMLTGLFLAYLVLIL